MSWELLEGELPGVASLWVPPGLEKDAGSGSAPLGAHPDHKETRGITGPRGRKPGLVVLGCDGGGQGTGLRPCRGAGVLALEVRVASGTQVGWVGGCVGPGGSQLTIVHGGFVPAVSFIF